MNCVAELFELYIDDVEFSSMNYFIYFILYPLSVVRIQYVCRYYN